MLLQSAGGVYDEVRGYQKFTKNSAHWKESVKFFSSACCYCGLKLTAENLTEDHLIPINKTSLGLHAWGNLVPSCHRCNKEKNSKNWKEFLALKSKGKLYGDRFARIVRFQKKFKYNPKINLKEIANNLYEDVGEVSNLLIQLRLRQAERLIKTLAPAVRG